MLHYEYIRVIVCAISTVVVNNQDNARNIESVTISHSTSGTRHRRVVLVLRNHCHIGIDVTLAIIIYTSVCLVCCHVTQVLEQHFVIRVLGLVLHLEIEALPLLVVLIQPIILLAKAFIHILRHLVHILVLGRLLDCEQRCFIEALHRDVNLYCALLLGAVLVNHQLQALGTLLSRCYNILVELH